MRFKYYSVHPVVLQKKSGTIAYLKSLDICFIQSVYLRFRFIGMIKYGSLARWREATLLMQVFSYLFVSRKARLERKIFVTKVNFFHHVAFVPEICLV